MASLISSSCTIGCHTPARGRKQEEQENGVRASRSSHHTQIHGHLTNSSPETILRLNRHDVDKLLSLLCGDSTQTCSQTHAPSRRHNNPRSRATRTEYQCCCGVSGCCLRREFGLFAAFFLRSAASRHSLAPTSSKNKKHLILLLAGSGRGKQNLHLSILPNNMQGRYMSRVRA